MTVLQNIWQHPEVLPFIGQFAMSYGVALILPLYVGGALHSKDRARNSKTRGIALLGLIGLATAVFAAIVAFPGPHVAEFGSKLGPFAWIAILLGACAAVVLVGYVLGMLASSVGLKP